MSQLHIGTEGTISPAECSKSNFWHFEALKILLEKALLSFRTSGIKSLISKYKGILNSLEQNLGTGFASISLAYIASNLVRKHRKNMTRVLNSLKQNRPIRENRQGNK
jgi:hypothetical protein